MNLSASQQHKLHDVVSEYMPTLTIIQTVRSQGGRALLVGGAVRDLLLGLPVKDLDIEIYGLQPEALEAILRHQGPVRLVGKAYGVFRLDGLDVDWSLPRSDKAGRKPEVTVDPAMTFESAFRRRDLTINAMGVDLHSFEIIDPFHGLDDLQNKILRAPDAATFAEDPLRFYRVMQFIGRFAMVPDKALNTLCANISLEGVSIERIALEFEKLLLLSPRPSLGLRWLREVGRLEDIVPELAATVGVPQNPAWHPEGDVFEHTMQTVDAAARFSYASDDEKLVMLYAALCHDLGKPAVTRLENGVIRSKGHEESGVEVARSLLKRVTKKNGLIDHVLLLVRHHRAPGAFVKEGVKPPAYKRLARALAPLTLEQLAKLALADKRGRNGQSHGPLTTNFDDIQEFLRRAEAAGVQTAPEKPLLVGVDLAPHVEPGPRMGELLKKAYQLQLEQGITDKTTLLKLIFKDDV